MLNKINKQYSKSVIYLQNYLENFHSVFHAKALPGTIMAFTPVDKNLRRGVGRLRFSVSYYMTHCTCCYMARIFYILTSMLVFLNPGGLDRCGI